MQAINYQAKGVNYPSLEETGSWCSSGLRALFPIERTMPGSVEKEELFEWRRGGAGWRLNWEMMCVIIPTLHFFKCSLRSDSWKWENCDWHVWNLQQSLVKWHPFASYQVYGLLKLLNTSGAVPSLTTAPIRSIRFSISEPTHVGPSPMPLRFVIFHRRWFLRAFFSLFFSGRKGRVGDVP